MRLLDHLAIGIDFSEPSRLALAACFRLAGLAAVKRVSIIHSVQEVVVPHGDQPAVKERLESLRIRMHDAAMKQMASMCETLEQPEGVEITRHIVEGTPSRAIPDAALALGASMLALGTHHRKGIRLWLKGSVAETIVRGAKIPVLVMPMGDDGVSPEAEVKNLQHVLVAVDLHKEADHVVAMAVEAAKSVKAAQPDVTIMTASDVQDFPFDAADADAVKEMADVKMAIASDAQSQLDALAKAHETSGVVIHTRLVQDEPADAILALAKELGVQLIVVGSHGRGAAPLLEMGSTTAKTLRGADVSVLVVPSHPEHLN